MSAVEHARSGTTELRTLAASVEALGGRLQITAGFGGQRLAFTEPGTEVAWPDCAGGMMFRCRLLAVAGLPLRFGS